MGAERLAAAFPDGIRAEFAKLYFDCAQAYAPELFGMLSKVVPRAHLLFGSDFSYFPVAHSIDEFGALGLGADAERAIGGGNASALFPRFSAP